MKLPKRLRKNPLIDVIAEVRFASDVPPDTVVGLVYSALKGDFGAPESLPILQLPSVLRDQDANFRYQPHYRFKREGHTLLLGPRSVALSTIPYDDWNATRPRLSNLLTTLDKLKLFGKVERVGLRYINFFEGSNVIEHSTLKLEIAGSSITGRSITLRTEHIERDFTVVTQIASNAKTETTPARTGSIIDLDITTDRIPELAKGLSKALLGVFAEANTVADQEFFILLKSDYIERFEPEY